MSRFFRVLWFSGGLAAVALGTLGMFLPLLPTVPFLLLAVWCFARSSPAWRHKILHHPFIGKPLREWMQYKGIRKSDKIFSIAFLWVSILVSVFLVAVLWLRLLLLAVAAAVTLHLLSFKTIK
ncbi:MAG: YbaN family protein [Prevotellaceae bacterium]|nr:YbaN family protein [Prevotellaceae bacterium]